MANKQYKAKEGHNLTDLMEWINEWSYAWTLHTFTHQEAENESWYVAVLEMTEEEGENG